MTVHQAGKNQTAPGIYDLFGLHKKPFSKIEFSESNVKIVPFFIIISACCMIYPPGDIYFYIENLVLWASGSASSP
jgi:hypothetical protein